MGAFYSAKLISLCLFMLIKEINIFSKALPFPVCSILERKAAYLSELGYVRIIPLRAVYALLYMNFLMLNKRTYGLVILCGLEVLPSK